MKQSCNSIQLSNDLRERIRKWADEHDYVEIQISGCDGEIDGKYHQFYLLIGFRADGEQDYKYSEDLTIPSATPMISQLGLNILGKRFNIDELLGIHEDVESIRLLDKEYSGN